MNKLTKFAFALLIFMSSMASFAQKQSGEKTILESIDWLEDTPHDQEADKRQMLNALLLQWLTDSKDVTVELNAIVLDYTKKNEDFLFIFMGGYARYCIQNNYSKDALKGSLAGLKSIIKVYKMGNGVKKDKNIEKLVELDNKGELEAWVNEKFAKQ